jgi:hypothetical protein
MLGPSSPETIGYWEIDPHPAVAESLMGIDGVSIWVSSGPWESRDKSWYGFEPE